MRSRLMLSLLCFMIFGNIFSQQAGMPEPSFLKGLQHDAGIIVAKTSGMKLSAKEVKIVELLKTASDAPGWNKTSFTLFDKKASAMRIVQSGTAGTESCTDDCKKNPAKYGCGKRMRTTCCIGECMRSVLKELTGELIQRLELTGEMQLL